MIYCKQEVIYGHTSNLTSPSGCSFFSVSWLTLICCQPLSSFRATYGAGRREDGLAHRVQRTWKLAHGQHPAVCLLCTGNCQYYCGFLLSVICANHTSPCTFLVTEVKPGHHFIFPKYLLFSHQTCLQVYAQEIILFLSCWFPRSSHSALLLFHCGASFSTRRLSNLTKVKKQLVRPNPPLGPVS